MIRGRSPGRGRLSWWQGSIHIEADFRRGGAQYKLKSVFKRGDWDNLDGYRLLADFVILDSGERINLLRRGK